jgi:hypothetical protein
MYVRVHIRFGKSDTLIEYGMCPGRLHMYCIHQAAATRPGEGGRRQLHDSDARSLPNASLSRDMIFSGRLGR